MNNEATIYTPIDIEILSSPFSTSSSSAVIIPRSRYIGTGNEYFIIQENIEVPMIAPRTQAIEPCIDLLFLIMIGFRTLEPIKAANPSPKHRQKVARPVCMIVVGNANANIIKAVIAIAKYTVPK